MKVTKKNVLDFSIVIVIFGLTGSTVAYLSGIIMHWLGAEPWTLFYIIGYILFIFPLYQSLILVYAFIFGKFRFFYERQKRIVSRIGKLFRRRDSKKNEERKTENGNHS